MFMKLRSDFSLQYLKGFYLEFFCTSLIFSICHYLLDKWHVVIVLTFWSSVSKYSSLYSSVAFYLVPYNTHQSSSPLHKYFSFEWGTDLTSSLYVSLESHQQDSNEIIMFTPGVIIPNLLCLLPMPCAESRFINTNSVKQTIFMTCHSCLRTSHFQIYKC